MFSNNQIHPVGFVFSSCCNMEMLLQTCLHDIVFSCSKKTIICADNIFNLFYYYWNLFYYFFFWGKHIYKMFFSLVISLTFTSFIRSLTYDGSSTDQWRAGIGSFHCHRLCLSKFKWNNNQMFLKIAFIFSADVQSFKH